MLFTDNRAGWRGLIGSCEQQLGKNMMGMLLALTGTEPLLDSSSKVPRVKMLISYLPPCQKVGLDVTLPSAHTHTHIYRNNSVMLI